MMCIRSTDICWRGRVFEIFSKYSNSFSLSLSCPPYHPSPFFPFFLCPQWATRARLRPFKNMEPVWPEWLLWKSSGLPDGLNPTRSGSYERKILSNDRTDIRSHLDPTYHEYYDLKKNWKKKQIHGIHQRPRAQIKRSGFNVGSRIKSLDHKMRPGREIDAFSCLHAAYISRYIKIIIN